VSSVYVLKTDMDLCSPMDAVKFSGLTGAGALATKMAGINGVVFFFFIESIRLSPEGKRGT